MQVLRKLSRAGTHLAGMLVVLCALAAHVPASAAVIYVDTNNPDPFPDGSLSSPFRTISQALFLSTSGDLINVAAGTYAETIVMVDGVNLLGAGPGSTIIDGTFSGNPVVTFDETKLNPRISGFTLRGGSGDAIGDVDGVPITAGGGILIVNSSPIIANCEIRDNIVDQGFTRGGGIYIDNLLDETPQILNSIIRNNVALSATEPDTGRGGGIYVNSKGSSVIISDNLIEDNVAHFGGGIYVRNSASAGASIQRNIIRSNEAVEGAGLFAAEFDDSTTNIVNNLIVDNGTALGVIDCDDTDPNISPNLPELCNDGLDNDCDAATPDIFDADGDGFTCDLDCDDNNAAVNPAAIEACTDGIDNDCDGLGDVVLVPVEAGTTMSYLANNVDPTIGLTWVDPAFDDTAWLSGPYGVGFENEAPGAENLLATTVPTNTKSIYTRVSFQVPDVSQVNTVIVDADYDDAYIVWMNGTEVFRSPEMGLIIPTWDFTPAPHESSNGATPDYGPPNDISAVAIPELVTGTNVMGIAVYDADSLFDLVLVPRLRMSFGPSDDPDCNLCVDGDSDGFSCQDCNDGDATISPGHPEICNDGIDNDCDPTTVDIFDIDGDGFNCTLDCDDNDGLVNPAASEVGCDNIDNDCNALTPDVFDADGDAFACDLDCDDASAGSFPGTFEFCFDGKDNNCDGFIDIQDPECGCENPVDVDGDGFRCRDCNDGNPLVNPVANEICADGIDNDCNAGTFDTFDADGDGVFCDLDCNDVEPGILPGGVEVCNDGIDNDCDTLTDLDDVDDCSCADVDGDGYACANDCNDSEPLANPGLPEICNDGIDNDCDAVTPDVFDEDQDGVTCITDCRDDNDKVFPGAAENCFDGIDNDCNGMIDFVDPLNPIIVIATTGTPQVYLANLVDPGIGLSWVQPNFDTSTWTNGVYGIGYENEIPGALELLGTIVPSGTASVYTRTQFFIPEVAGVTSMTLGLDYDDGVVAWINGVEVLRTPEMPAGDPAWDASPALHESSNGKAPNFTTFDITATALTALVEGANTLAVGIYNNIPGAGVSSELVLVPELSMTYGIDDPDCACLDADNDGYRCSDCDDTNPNLSPGNDEVPCEGFDNDCDGNTPDIFDVDGDGFACDVDCVDVDPAELPESPMINPGETETPCDFIDNDCNATTPDFVDQDGDGFNCDCDDNDINVSPAETEIACDSIDNDCNTLTSDIQDEDGDGFFCDADCNDSDSAINDNGVEKCDDLVDNDCDGDTDLADSDCACADLDFDGYACSDCNDAEVLINPGVAEVCNDGIDNDCNPATLDVLDADGDGFDCLNDCDDQDPFVSPGAAETCNDGIDNDCNPGTTDILDFDGDGHLCDVDCDDSDDTISPTAPELCNDGIDNDCNPTTFDIFDVDVDTFDCTFDCNDNDGAINPDATEICADTIDNDCNAATVDLFDGDGDGFTCDLDCNDLDATVNANAAEQCTDTVDNDCDGDTDGLDTDCSGCPDMDSDGYACDDCNDGDGGINPGVVEVCNDTIDNDCDPSTLDLGDLDGDGFTCDIDCNDGDPAINPGASEVCSNSTDDDCNPGTGDLQDADGDGSICRLDCDDTNPNIRPGLPDIPCDGIDNDCNSNTLDSGDGDGDSVTCADLSVRGGGIAGTTSAFASVTIVNNTLVGNAMPLGVGGAIWLDDIASVETSTVANNIMATNVAFVGGGIDLTAFFGDVKNNAFHQNAVPDIYDSDGGPGGAVIEESILADPMFVAPAASNYRLSAGSPLIDSGNDVLAPNNDAEKFPRPFDGDEDTFSISDVGAYEYPSGEVFDLQFTGTDDMTWEAMAGLKYNVYRGRLTRLKSQGIYTQNTSIVAEAEQFCGFDGVGLPFVDTYSPPAGAVFYLVTVSIGNFEGTLGHTSAGAVRPNDNSCP